MSTSFRPISIPPGVVSNPTKNVGASNYSEVNMVRWGATVQTGGGELEPIGGQSKYAFTFASRCKKVHGWYGLDGIFRTAYLCESNLYVIAGADGALVDITPSGGITAPALPLTGGYSDGLYNDGPPPTYGTPRTSGPAALIDKVPDAFSLDNFGAILLAMTSPDGRLLHWDPAVTANVNDVQTLTTTGAPTGGTFTLGFGAQTTASIVYNATAANVQSALTALSNIGSGNVVCAGGPLPAAITITFQGALGNAQQSTLTVVNNALTGGGAAEAPNIVHTTVGASTLATAITPAPGSTVPQGRCFVVTPERFVQIFGSHNDGTGDGGSSRRFAWCNQEDFTNWAYSDLTSQAGFMDIEPASPIICAISTRTGTLFFTSKKAYRSRYLGMPYVYSLDELGDSCTPWSPQSMTNTSSMVVWMSQQGAFAYDGTSIVPITVAVWGWINDDIDLLNVREQACAVHVANFNEVWWHFPQGPQTNPSGYNSRAVIYNYRDGWWSQARIARSAGVTASYASHTIMANGTISYEHESGNVYWDCDLPWVETFDLNALGTTSAAAFQGMGVGGKLLTIKQLIPDIKGAASNILYSLFYRNSRSLGTPELQTTPRSVRSDGYVDFRTTGRDIRLRIDLAVPAGQIIDGVASDGAVLPVTVGQHLIDAVLRGDR